MLGHLCREGFRDSKRQPVIGRESLPFLDLVKCRSRSYERQKVPLLALSCFVAPCFLAVSSASAQDPATVGQFSSVTTWPYKAVHANLLSTGKVLWWHSFGQGDNPTLWNPSTNTNTAA